MTLGKALRLRRIFSRGRALVIDSQASREDPVAWIRLLARGAPDAVILTPGLLDVVAEELGNLAVIVGMASGAPRIQPLISVQAALEMGAEAVTLPVAAAVGESVERFARMSEEARRLGMPVMAEVLGEDWLEAAWLSADYGADVIRIPPRPEGAALRSCTRATGRPVLVELELPPAAWSTVLKQACEVMQGPAQGIVLSVPGLPSGEAVRLLEALHGLVHQDIALEEAYSIAGITPPEG